VWSTPSEPSPNLVQIIRCICGPRLITVEILACERRVDIEYQIYSSGGEVRHASIVIQRRIHRIYSHSVDTQFLHQVDISSATFGIGQRIVVPYSNISWSAGLILITVSTRWRPRVILHRRLWPKTTLLAHVGLIIEPSVHSPSWRNDDRWW